MIRSLAFLLAALAVAAPVSDNGVSVIPEPRFVERADGSFLLAGPVRIAVPAFDVRFWDAAESLKIHGLVIHPGRHEVLANGKAVDLTASEFRILHHLARRPGWVFTRGQIIDAVHGEDYPVTDRSVDVQVAALRKKLGKAGECIETVRGVGYRCKE